VTGITDESTGVLSPRIANDNNAIEEWTFEKGGTCHTCVTPFGLQFTFHQKSSYMVDLLKSIP